MIDWLPVFIGIFFLACITNNKEWKKEGNSDIYLFLTGGPFILVPILMGLGFIFPLRMSMFPNHSLLWPFQIFCAALTAFSKGTVKVISRIAWVAVLAYIIMGSFM